MPDYAFAIAVVAAVMSLGAWREYVSDNRRDAKLMAALGAAGMVAGTVVWLARQKYRVSFGSASSTTHATTNSRPVAPEPDLPHSRLAAPGLHDLVGPHMSKPSPSMRHYPRNSPHAAARIVALALISNGEVKPSEIAVLGAMRAREQLNLTRQDWHDVVHALCADLLASATQGTDCIIDSRMVERLLGDVDDVTLQRLVLRLCTAVIHADGEIDHGESIVLLAAIDRWGLHPDDHGLLESLLYGLDFQVRPRGAKGNIASASTAHPAG